MEVILSYRLFKPIELDCLGPAIVKTFVGLKQNVVTINANRDVPKKDVILVAIFNIVYCSAVPMAAELKLEFPGIDSPLRLVIVRNLFAKAC